jgi:hypothetical protein
MIHARNCKMGQRHLANFEGDKNYLPSINGKFIA